MNTEFLVLQIVNHINWKNYIVDLISKLSGTCYAVRLMVYMSNWRVCCPRGSNRVQQNMEKQQLTIMYMWKK